MSVRFDPILGRLIHFEVSADGDGGDGGGGARPDWLLDKFDSPEAQARAYAAAEAEMQRIRSESERDREEFREALERIEASQAHREPEVRAAGSDPLLEAYQRALDEGDGAAALAITLQLAGAQFGGMLDQKLEPLNERFQTESASTREVLIDTAEAAVAQEARAAGLDYEASRDEIAQAILTLGGLPTSGTLEDYKEGIRRGVKIVHAEAVLTHSSQQEEQRRAKLSAMTTPVGVPGRVAQGSPQEKDAWAEIKAAKTGSYAELRSGAR